MRSWCYRTRLAAGRVCWCFTSRPHARGASEHMSGISMHAHVGRLVLVCGGIVRAFASGKRSPPPPPPPPPPKHILTFRMNSSCVNSSSTSSSGSCVNSSSTRFVLKCFMDSRVLRVVPRANATPAMTVCMCRTPFWQVSASVFACVPVRVSVCAVDVSVLISCIQSTPVEGSPWHLIHRR